MIAYAIRWAIDVAEENAPYHRDLVAAARAELADLEAVVVEEMPASEAQTACISDLADRMRVLVDLLGKSEVVRSLTSPVDTAPTHEEYEEAVHAEFEAALDAEGVSEPGTAADVPMAPTGVAGSPGSLTSPVDTAPGAKP